MFSMRNTYRNGDTLIEVLLAFSVFSMVAIMGMTVMNQGINSVQTSLESTMARSELDSQAEALRFIQGAYLAERGLSAEEQQYTALWLAIIAKAEKEVPKWGADVCGGTNLPTDEKKIFAINPRMLYRLTSNDPSDSFTAIKNDLLLEGGASGDQIKYTASIYPRILYEGDEYSNGIDPNAEKPKTAEGIWVIAVQSSSAPDPSTGKIDGAFTESGQFIPNYYDFHIRACWNAMGSKTVSTHGTIIRLYNPLGISVKTDYEYCIDQGKLWVPILIDPNKCITEYELCRANPTIGFQVDGTGQQKGSWDPASNRCYVNSNSTPPNDNHRYMNNNPCTNNGGIPDEPCKDGKCTCYYMPNPTKVAP